MTSPLRQIVLVAGVSAAAMPWNAALAQKDRGNAQISGRVIDASTRTPLARADIIHLGLGKVVVSDSLGRYAFPELPSGIVRLLVRRGGFPSLTVTVALARGEWMTRDIMLDSSQAARAAAQSLPSVSVHAPKPPEPRYADFERRRLTGLGQYITRKQIEQEGFANLQDAMRGLRGVNLDCGGAGVNDVSGSSLGCNIRMSRATMMCTPEYIVDERVDNDFGPSTPIRDIEGIEVYTGATDVPGEFAGRFAGCGVIVIWTKNGPRRKQP